MAHLKQGTKEKHSSTVHVLWPQSYKEERRTHMGGLGMRHRHITLNPVPSALALVLVRRSSPCSREAMARICGGGRLLPPHCVPMLATAGSVDVSRGQGLPHQNRRSSPLPDTFCALPALGAYSTVFGTTPPCSSRACRNRAMVNGRSQGRHGEVVGSCGEHGGGMPSPTPPGRPRIQR